MSTELVQVPFSCLVLAFGKSILLEKHALPAAPVGSLLLWIVLWASLASW